jgi:hypothetical protein
MAFAYWMATPLSQTIIQRREEVRMMEPAERES